MGIDLYANSSVCAVFENTAGDAPISSPLAHLDKLKFHSSLDYVEFDQKVTGSVTLPARTYGSVGTALYPILAHGRSAAPLVTGICTILGNEIPLAGFTPIQTAIAGQFRRAIFVSSDATYVYLGESYLARGPASAAIEFASVLVSYTVYLSRRTMPYAAPVYAADMLNLSAAQAIMGRGRFDASKKYFRADSTGALMADKGRTGSLYVAGAGVAPFYNAPQWGYKCGSYEFNAAANAGAGFVPGTPTRIDA